MFFMSVGMLLDLKVIADRPLTVIGLAIGGDPDQDRHPLPCSPARSGCRQDRVRFSLALLLSQAGEFGFVLFAQAQRAQLIPAERRIEHQCSARWWTTSMVDNPVPDEADRRGFRRISPENRRSTSTVPNIRPKPTAIVVGYGRFGQTVGQMLMAKRIGVTIIDLDAEMIDVASEFGWKVYYGDGTRIDLLRTAGAGEARAILFCNDGESLNRSALERVLEAFPQASVMARVFDRRQLIDLRGLDLAFAQRELFESAVAMGRKALAELGIDATEIDRVESAYRLRDCERLERQSEAGDYRAGRDQIFAENRALADPEDMTGL